MLKNKRRKKRSPLKIVLWVLGGVFLLWLIAYFSGLTKGKDVIEVTLGEVKKVKIIETVSASGTIQPEAEVKISPDVSGEIVDVMVEEGDSVIAGQMLLRIRPDNFQAAVQNSQAGVNTSRANYAQTQSRYEQAVAQLLRSKADFERNKELFDQDVISEADFQQFETNFRVAQKEVEAATQQMEASKFTIQSAQATLNQNLDVLSRTEIYAPVSGTVSKLDVEQGEKVVGTAQMAGTEMLIIANLNNMEVRVNVNENDIVRVKLGQEVNIEVDAYGERKFKGIVTKIANTANTKISEDAITEFEVRIRILNESYKDLIKKKGSLSPFRPGMTASVEIITNTKENVTSVPLASVTTRKPDSEQADEEGRKEENKEKNPLQKDEKPKQVIFVYNEKEKKALMREVETGISDFENIEIKKGVEIGDKIITGPFAILSNEEKLKDKSEVKEKEDKKEKSE